MGHPTSDGAPAGEVARRVPVVVDGGLSTALAQAGHDLDDPLWTARLVADEPGAIVDAHLAYLRAGARVLVTSSYQASRRGFAAAGYVGAEADALLARTTALAREAVERFALDDPIGATGARVAASIGPYGAVLADGSEYRGNYVQGVPGAGPHALDDEALVSFHAERLRVLLATAPDLLAIETIPSAVEAVAIGEAIRRAGSELGVSAPPAWCAFSCRDGAHTCAGDGVGDAARAAAEAIPGLVAVGVNCTAPEHVGVLLARVRAATGLPLVVYPNAGGAWDAATNAWTGERHDPFAPGTVDAAVGHWSAAGAAFVGGCCGTGPDEIARLAAAVGRRESASG